MKSAQHLFLRSGVAISTFFAMAGSAPQCSRTEEMSLNPTLESLADGNPCVQACIGDYQTAKKAEQVRFKAAMEACNGSSDCREEEATIHDQVLGELAQAKDDCIVNCEHQQGDATGGQ
jgi:hypothetical protein